MLLIESLEPRTLLSAATGISLGTAENLGGLSGRRTLDNTVLAARPNHYYKLTIARKGNFNATLASISGDADLQLLNSQGRPLNASAHRGKVTEHIGRLLGSGVYYVKVTQGAASGATSYRLSLQADHNWGSVSFDGQRRSVGLVFLDNAPRPIKPNMETWIVIHGWQGNPQDGSIHRLQQVLQAGHPQRQVLALDWSAAADDFSVITAAGWIPSVAQFAADTLAQWGLDTSHINIAGHSLGGWMTNELAADVPGGVNRIIAMDPATDLAGLFVSGVDYAAHSQASIAFIGSEFSTTPAAATAAESFRMKVGPTISFDSHDAVVDLTASMIADGNDNPISRLLALDTLTATAGPWKLDAYKGGVDPFETDPTFEGIITGQQSADHWQPVRLVYKDAATGKTVTVSK